MLSQSIGKKYRRKEEKNMECFLHLWWNGIDFDFVIFFYVILKSLWWNYNSGIVFIQGKSYIAENYGSSYGKDFPYNMGWFGFKLNW